MKISQSLIKDVKKYQCSEFINLRYKERVQTSPSTPMMQGLYFESELIGSARGGKYEMPLLKSGKPSKAQLDVDAVIARAFKVLEKSNIVVQDIQVYKENGNASGHIDFIGTINGNKAIFDVKFTGLALSRWESEMKYGGTAESFDIQSSHYQKLYEDEKLDFYFLVFSSAGWDKIYLKPFSQESIKEAEDRINETSLDLLGEMKADSNTCNICPLNDVCKVREFVPKIEII